MTSRPSHEQHHAYILLRLLTGIDFFGHGFARIFTGTHLSGFASGMAASMAATPLPHALLLATGYAIPVVELLIGTALIFGLAVRHALIAALLLMCVLMFGITLKQDWNVAGQQLLYGLVISALLAFREHYDLSWPDLVTRRGDDTLLSRIQ